MLISFLLCRQVSSLGVEGDEAVSGNAKGNFADYLSREFLIERDQFSIPAFYTPKNKHPKADKPDTSEALSPFIASATSFLSALSADSGKTTSIHTNPNGVGLDKAVLFANSIVPDLQKFDDEHFALIKMIISKDIYDVLLKQISKVQKQ